MAQLSLIFTPKADYGTQWKELEGLVQAINTKLSSLEEWIATNHYDLMARFENVKIISNGALHEVIISAKPKKQELLNKDIEKV